MKRSDLTKLCATPRADLTERGATIPEPNNTTTLCGTEYYLTQRLYQADRYTARLDGTTKRRPYQAERYDARLNATKPTERNVTARCDYPERIETELGDQSIRDATKSRRPNATRLRESRFHSTRRDDRTLPNGTKASRNDQSKRNCTALFRTLRHDRTQLNQPNRDGMTTRIETGQKWYRTARPIGTELNDIGCRDSASRNHSRTRLYDPASRHLAATRPFDQTKRNRSALNVTLRPYIADALLNITLRPSESHLYSILRDPAPRHFTTKQRDSLRDFMTTRSSIFRYRTKRDAT